MICFLHALNQPCHVGYLGILSMRVCNYLLLTHKQDLSQGGNRSPSDKTVRSPINRTGRASVTILAHRREDSIPPKENKNAFDT
jgi:hypothetical protein